jgi:hypothetical protein
MLRRPEIVKTAKGFKVFADVSVNHRFAALVLRTFPSRAAAYAALANAR